MLEGAAAEHLPYVIKIVNLGMEDRTGPYPLVSDIRVVCVMFDCMGMDMDVGIVLRALRFRIKCI